MDIFLVEPQATLLWEKSRKFDLRLDARAQARVMDIFSVEPQATLMWGKSRKFDLRLDARAEVRV